MYKLLKEYLALQKRTQKIKNEYLSQRAKNCGNVHFYNWWNVEDYQSLWLYKFVQNTGLLDNTNKHLNFCSLFESRKVLDHVNDGVKIFFSGENLRLPSWAHYADALLGDNDCQLSLGFDYFEDERYLRFPLWLTYVFEPVLEENIIKQRCEELRYPQLVHREKFACMIARADISGVRTEMYKQLTQAGKVDCPSGLFHNDDSLVQQYADDKISYMRNYLFNICPENSNAYGYCTEKIFEAIMAGCIPVYWGNFNKPENDILNQDAIIFWEKEGTNENAIQKIKELYNNKQMLLDFMQQPRLIEGAEGKIVDYFSKLQEKIKILL